MARLKKAVVATTAKTGKLVVAKNHGCIIFDTISIKKNSNGKEYIATPYGAVYMSLDKIKINTIYKVVEFEPQAGSDRGALACNETSRMEKLVYLSQEFPGQDLDKVATLFGL